MGPHRFFVQIVEKEKQTKVQEIDPKLFSWLQQLPIMDNAVNEPNLLELERYPKEGLFQPLGNVEAFYAGVARMSDNALVRQYHYFFLVKPSKLKNYKKKPYFIADQERILQDKNKAGDSR